MTTTEKLFHFVFLLFTISGQSKQKSDEGVDASTSQQCVAVKKRMVFDKAELASAMVERLANSMDIAKDQVIKKTLTFWF